MNQPKTCVMVAAGTGGHVMPCLAVGQALQARGWQLAWIGTKTGMEQRLVAPHGIAFEGLDFVGLRGRGMAGLLGGAFKLVKAFFTARTLLKRLKPDVMFSTGGYVSVPVAWAAKTLGIDVVMMNCDADMLLSVEMVLPVAKKVACGFAGSALTKAGAKGVLTGNPVRQQIADIASPSQRMTHRQGPLNVLVFGGSLGAKVFNDVMPEALSQLAGKIDIALVHQTGKGRDEEVRAHYERLGLQATVKPFIDDMAAAYEQADLVICRAGATSVAELCAAGSASILVPFVVSTTSHQAGNARWMGEKGASLVMRQADFTPENVAYTLTNLTRSRLMSMGERAREQAKADAAHVVAEMIIQTQA